MTPTQLARALAGLAPPLQRAILAQLFAWERAGRRAALRDIEAAIAAGDTRAVVRLLLGDSVADVVVIGPPPFPDASIAFGSVATPAAIAAASRTEQALIRAAAEAAIQASRVASAALPPVPPGVRTLGTPSPAPRSGLLTISQGTRVATAPGAAGYGGDALRYLRASAHEGIVAAVNAGNAAGLNPRDVARGLRDVVGLGESQAVWVSNLRAELERGPIPSRKGAKSGYERALERQLLNGPIRQTVAARVKSGKPLTSAEIDKIVAGYAQKWRAWHAETIARTTGLDLLRAGTIAQARAAQASGAYGSALLTKRWVTRLDGRERPAHRALNGATIPLAARWLDDGVPRDVPGGFNCRCAVVIRVGVQN